MHLHIGVVGAVDIFITKCFIDPRYYFIYENRGRFQRLRALTDSKRSKSNRYTIKMCGKIRK